MAEPPDHLSSTGWTKFEQCPRAWASHYIDGITEPASAAMEIGTFAHKVLEELMGYPAVQRSVALARWLATREWPAAERTSIDRGEITETIFKRQAFGAICGLWDLEDPTQADVVATEERICWTEGDVPMVAVVDRVDRCGRDSLTPGLLTILDYKTSAEFKPKWQADKKRQITIGALAVASQDAPFGPLAVAPAGALLYVGSEPAVTLPAPTDREARAAVSEAAQGVWADIGRACADEDFPAKTSGLCGWCPCVAECREGQSHIRRAESGGWSWYSPDLPGAKVVAALDAA